MPSEPKPLFRAFQEDHAVLGKGFYEIAACLRGKDLPGARRVAARLNQEAGAHIAFEEASFYPALARISGFETERLFDEHGEGLSVVRTLLEMSDTDDMNDEMRQALLANAEAMEDHIAECGNLFEAIAKMSAKEQQSLYEELVRWREKHPTWLDYSRERQGRPAK